MPDGGDSGKSGYVYVFENDWMPEIVKIGMTSRTIEERLYESSQGTFVPCEFTCTYAIKSGRYDRIEDYVQKAFKRFQINPKREFFQVTASEAIQMLRGLVDLDIATEVPKEDLLRDSVAVSKKLIASGDSAIVSSAPRTPNTTFKMLGVSVGSRLVYKPDMGKGCETVDEKNLVSVGGEELSISALASRWAECNVNGFAYFRLDGETETLREKRDRLAGSK